MRWRVDRCRCGGILACTSPSVGAEKEGIGRVGVWVWLESALGCLEGEEGL